MFRQVMIYGVHLKNTPEAIDTQRQLRYIVTNTVKNKILEPMVILGSGTLMSTSL